MPSRLPPQLLQGVGDPVRVAAGQVALLLAQALAPHLGHAHAGALNGLALSEVGGDPQVPAAPVAGAELPPVGGDRGLQVLGDQSEPLVDLDGRALALLGGAGDLPGQVQLLPCLLVSQRLSPDLLDLVLGQVPGLALALAGDHHGPHAAVARGVGEEAILGVGGAEEDALARVVGHPALVGSAVDVVLAREEGAQGLGVGLAHPGELSELVDPEALQLLGGCLVPRVGQRQGVVEPIARQSRHEGGLADALRAREHEHGVELDPGALDPPDGRAQQLAGDGAGVVVVRRAESVHQERVDARRAVPFGQGAQVVAHGVEAPLVGDDGQSVTQVAFGEARVAALDVGGQVGVVDVAPGAGWAGPGQDVAHGDGAPQLVVGDALQVRVRAQEPLQVGQGGAQASALVGVQVEAAHPLTAVAGDVLELGRDVGQLLLAHLGQVRGPGLHGLERGRAASGVLAALVLVSEAVEAHQVEGVAQLPACGVGSVVGVGEQAVVVDDEAAGGLAGGVGVARVVDPLVGGDELLDGLGDGVGAAERAYDAALVPGVGLAVAAVPGVGAQLARGRGPCAGVRPVLVGGQDLVGVEEAALVVLMHVLPVGAGGRPVHEPVGLVGGVVEGVHAHP